MIELAYFLILTLIKLNFVPIGKRAFGILEFRG